MWSKTITSESAPFPGVRYTIHRMGIARRTEVEMQTLEFRQRLREIEIEYPEYSPKERELQEQLGIAIRKSIAVPDDERAAAIEEADAIRRDIEAAGSLDARKQRIRLDTEYELIVKRSAPFWIRAGLLSIEGGEFNGMGPDDLLDCGPKELAEEIYQAIVGDARIGPAESKNSPSPTITGAPGQAESQSIGVPIANAAAIMPSETAFAGSPAG